MGRPARLPTSIARLIEAEQAAEAVEQRRRQDIADGGPPIGSGISPTNWHFWHLYDFVLCPAKGVAPTCTEAACGIGQSCAVMAAMGLTGDGRPLPWADRPLCGARTRSGSSCMKKAEAGRRRCRLHGGASTGPRTAEGKARNAAATRARWKRIRAERDG